MKESGQVDWLWDEVDNYFNQRTSHLQGRLLTQLEASMPPGRQLEALKEIMNSILWEGQQNDWRILNGLFREYVQSSKVSTITFAEKA